MSKNGLGLKLLGLKLNVCTSCTLWLFDLGSTAEDRRCKIIKIMSTFLKSLSGIGQRVPTFLLNILKTKHLVLTATELSFQLPTVFVNFIFYPIFRPSHVYSPLQHYQHLLGQTVWKYVLLPSFWRITDTHCISLQLAFYSVWSYYKHCHRTEDLSPTLTLIEQCTHFNERYKKAV